MMGVGWNLGMVSWFRGYKAKVVKFVSLNNLYYQMVYFLRNMEH